MFINFAPLISYFSSLKKPEFITVFLFSSMFIIFLFRTLSRFDFGLIKIDNFFLFNYTFSISFNILIPSIERNQIVFAD